MRMDLQKGLVGHWTLGTEVTSNDTAYDSSAYDSHGTISGATSKSSIIGDSLYFDGTDSMEISGPTVDSITVSSWLKPTELGSDNYQWFVPSGDIARSYIQSNDSSINWKIDGNDIGSNYSLTTNNWHHITQTYNAGTGTQKIYTNGTEDVSTSYSASTLNLGTTYIGADVLDDYDNYHGNISDLRIYDRALSEREISALYNMRSQRNANI